MPGPLLPQFAFRNQGEDSVTDFPPFHLVCPHRPAKCVTKLTSGCFVYEEQL